MKVKRLVEFPEAKIKNLEQIAKETKSIGVTSTPDGMVVKYKNEKDADKAFPKFREVVGRRGQVQQGRIAKSSIFIYYL